MQIGRCARVVSDVNRYSELQRLTIKFIHIVLATVFSNTHQTQNEVCEFETTKKIIIIDSVYRIDFLKKIFQFLKIKRFGKTHEMVGKKLNSC